MIDAQGWVLIITAVFLGLTNILTLIYQQRAAFVSKQIHGLVNSAMEAQLLLNRNTTARLAALTGSTDDISNAEIAAKAWESHHGRQSAVDKM